MFGKENGEHPCVQTAVGQELLDELYVISMDHTNPDKTQTRPIEGMFIQ